MNARVGYRQRQLFTATQLFHGRLMSSTKSEEEWRAILSPAQVIYSLPCQSSGISDVHHHISSEFFARKEQKHRELDNMNITKRREYTLAPDVTRHCTRAQQSSQGSC
jgi:hypothetical protein